jgi:hypothetical protein
MSTIMILVYFSTQVLVADFLEPYWISENSPLFYIMLKITYFVSWLIFCTNHILSWHHHYLWRVLIF